MTQKFPTRRNLAASRRALFDIIHSEDKQDLYGSNEGEKLLAAHASLTL